MGNAGRYGQRRASNMGIIFSLSAVSDNAATTLGNMGQIVVDMTDGKLYSIDSSTKTQEITQ